MKNVHKLNIQGIRLPIEMLEEDRGYKTCPQPFLTFANPNDTSISWQNDLFSVAFIADTVEVELVKNGTIIPADGIPLTFPHQSNAVGFMVVWSQVLINHGAGCYKLRANYTIQGVPFTLHYGSFDLKPYSVEESEGTIRVLGQYNDLVKKYGINFKESNFATSFRVKGNIHNEQPNTEHGNILKENDRFSKYRNFGQITYDLETAPIPACQLDYLFEIIYAANKLYISDFNKANFRQYRDVEVVLRDEDEMRFGDQFGETRQLLAYFKNKTWLIESKYSGREGDEVVFTSGLDFGFACAPATITITDQNGNVLGVESVPSGASETVEVNVPQDLFYQLNFHNTDDTAVITVTADALGTLTSGSGVNVGTIEVSTDNVNFIALSFPFVPILNETYFFRRSNTAVSGVFTLIGSYV